MTKGCVPVLPDNVPKPGEIYKHYKGDSYEVTGIALHSNDNTWMVVYKPPYENPAAELFARPLTDWNEMVIWDDKEVRRFALV
jgi:hypothetical protein